MKTIDGLTNNEKNLLLFLECAQVDYSGRYIFERTNAEDQEKLEEWKLMGFLDHGRVSFHDIRGDRRHWVHLSPEAMALAQEVRRKRADYLWDTRTWRSTEEKRAAGKED